jgi:hypothetical protein
MTWAPVQAETDHSNLPFYQGEPKVLQSQTLLQDAGRTAILYPNTVMAQIASSRKWVPLSDCDPAPTAGKMKCGAYGATLVATAAVTAGSFKIQVDGETALDITGLDFSEIQSLSDTSASCVCGANGCNLATWQGITNGGFAITVDGTLCTIADVSFVTITALSEVAERINNHLTALNVECRYNQATDKYSFHSRTKGKLSTITAISAGGTTDISGATRLNGLTGTAVLTQGAGSDGSGLTMEDVINASPKVASAGLRCVWDGVAFTFISPTLGVNSAVSVLTAGSAGTDISGAGYLNGLTGTGTATAGTYLDGSEIPMGIYRGGNILAASLVAGDVTGCEIVVGGDCLFDATNVVFDSTGSVTMNTVIPTKGMTVARALEQRGLYGIDTAAADANV